MFNKLICGILFCFVTIVSSNSQKLHLQEILDEFNKSADEIENAFELKVPSSSPIVQLFKDKLSEGLKILKEADAEKLSDETDDIKAPEFHPVDEMLQGIEMIHLFQRGISKLVDKDSRGSIFDEIGLDVKHLRSIAGYMFRSYLSNMKSDEDKKCDTEDAKEEINNLTTSTQKDEL